MGWNSYEYVVNWKTPYIKGAMPESYPQEIAEELLSWLQANAKDNIEYWIEELSLIPVAD